jgi:hypothetical protein
MQAQAAARGMANVVIMWGESAVTNNWSGLVPGRLSGATPGFVVLSDVGYLPWGDKGQRGGIYTWDHGMKWELKADYLILTFSHTCREERE